MPSKTNSITTTSANNTIITKTCLVITVKRPSHKVVADLMIFQCDDVSIFGDLDLWREQMYSPCTYYCPVGGLRETIEDITVRIFKEESQKHNFNNNTYVVMLL